MVGMLVTDRGGGEGMRGVNARDSRLQTQRYAATYSKITDAAINRHFKNRLFIDG